MERDLRWCSWYLLQPPIQLGGYCCLHTLPSSFSFSLWYFWASCVPSFWCWHHFGWPHPLPLFSDSSEVRNLTSVLPRHYCHFLVGSPGICGCPEHLLCCPLVVKPLQFWSSFLSMIPTVHTYLVWMTSWCHCCRSRWGASGCTKNEWCHDVQLDVIHAEEVAGGCPITESVPVAALVYDLTERDQTCAEQQGEGASP